jgi:hypothetical protein
VSSIHADDEASDEEHTKDFVYDHQGRVVPPPQLLQDDDYGDLSASSEPNDPNVPTYLPSDESTTSWPEDSLKQPFDLSSSHQVLMCVIDIARRFAENVPVFVATVQQQSDEDGTGGTQATSKEHKQPKEASKEE